jgi:thiol-disulfide isomerase/thioredoxin
MKKRLSFILLGSAIIMGLCFISMKIVETNHEKEKQKALLATLPVFSSPDMKSHIIDDNLLTKNTPSVFIAFHPECEHCQYEAKSINDKQKELANTNIIMFTSANDSLIHAFARAYGLDSLKNVHILNDSTNTMRQLFAIKAMPTVIIYNAQNQLVKRFNGETKIDAILKYAQ